MNGTESPKKEPAAKKQKVETEPDRATAPCLTDNELRAITKLAKTIYLGSPVNIRLG